MKHLVPISLLLAGAGYAQAPVIVLSPGDILPDGSSVRVIQAAEVGADGGWIALFSTNEPNGNVGSAALTSEGDFMGTGDPAPGIPTAVIRGVTHIARGDQGLTYCEISIRHQNGIFQSAITRNFAEPVLDDDDLVGGIGMSAFHDIETNSGGDLMIVGRFTQQTHVPVQYRGIAIPQFSSGTATGLTTLVDGSVPPPGQAAPMNVFSTGEDNCVLGDQGHLAWCGILATSPSVRVAYNHAGSLLFQSGTPSPIAGRLWSQSASPSFDINASGSILMASALEGPPLDDEVYVRDGVVVRRENDPVPGHAGLGFKILDRVVNLSDDGELIHWAVLSGLPNSSNEVIMKADEIIVREGVTLTASGQLIEQMTSATRASSDGRWILINAWLAGDNSARLMLVEAKSIIGAPYCSAEPNSTGNMAVTCAYGSDTVSDTNVRLSCTDMPAITFGYFLASRTQGDVLFPGGSEGRLCLGGDIGRFVAFAQNSNFAGTIDVGIDLASIPVNPFAPVLPGETWNFQAWFRDFGTPPTSNFSLPVSVAFQ